MIMYHMKRVSGAIHCSAAAGMDCPRAANSLCPTQIRLEFFCALHASAQKMTSGTANQTLRYSPDPFLVPLIAAVRGAVDGSNFASLSPITNVAKPRAAQWRDLFVTVVQQPTRLLAISEMPDLAVAFAMCAEQLDSAYAMRAAAHDDGTTYAQGREQDREEIRAS